MSSASIQRVTSPNPPNLQPLPAYHHATPYLSSLSLSPTPYVMMPGTQRSPTS